MNTEIPNNPIENAFITDVRQILEHARQKAYAATAFAMNEGYWLMGQRLVEHEQQGKFRAEYGQELLKKLSTALGKGFSTRTLRENRQFYLFFPTSKIWRTRSPI